MREEFKKAGSEIKTAMIGAAIEKVVELAPVLIDKFIGMIKDALDPQKDPKPKIINLEIEFLNKEKLVQIAKENVASGANEVCAMLKRGTDCDFIYLAYSKDRELLKTEENAYVVIKCGDLSRDIVSMFGDKELIILN